MNDQISKLAKKSGFGVRNDEIYTSRLEHLPITENIEKLVELIVQECTGICDEHPAWTPRMIGNQIAEHFGVKRMTEARQHIGYVEREEGFYKIYAPPRGSITTQAFILCKYCNGCIYHCGGPKLDAVCCSCYDKDPENR